MLLAIPGCGVITAARLIAEIANVGRFASMPSWPLCRRGADPGQLGHAAPAPPQPRRQPPAQRRAARDRAHPSALHPPAREYLARRKSDGKTPKEGLRALKRHLARLVYRLFTAIHGRDSRPPLEVTSAPSAPCLT